jgi:hypothetical protein
MKFLVHEGHDTTGPMGWYESSVDVVPGNTIAVPGGKTFTVDHKAVNEIGGKWRTISGRAYQTGTQEIVLPRLLELGRSVAAQSGLRR